VIGLILAFLSQPAFAERPAGHYHPDSVAAASERFSEAAAHSGAKFGELQQELTKTGQALQDLDLSVALLGGDAPQSLTQEVARTRKLVTGQFLQVQKHVDLIQDDYATTFGTALNRALESMQNEWNAKECQNRVGAALSRQGRPCVGDDLNTQLAKQIDKDPELEQAIKEIHSIAWPELKIPVREMELLPLTGTTNGVDLVSIARAYADPMLARRIDDFDRALSPLVDGIEANETAAIEAGQNLREAYEAALANDGEALMTSAKEALIRAEKRGGPTNVGICANPAALGGCGGEDMTQMVLGTLASDRRFGRETAFLREQ